MYYIGSSSTLDNDRWSFVYHGVPDSSPLVIARRDRCEEFAPNVSFEFFYRCFSDFGSPSRSDNLQLSNPWRGEVSRVIKRFLRPRSMLSLDPALWESLEPASLYPGSLATHLPWDRFVPLLAATCMWVRLRFSRFSSTRSS